LFPRWWNLRAALYKSLFLPFCCSSFTPPSLSLSSLLFFAREPLRLFSPPGFYPTPAPPPPGHFFYLIKIKQLCPCPPHNNSQLKTCPPHLLTRSPHVDSSSLPFLVKPLIVFISSPAPPPQNPTPRTPPHNLAFSVILESFPPHPSPSHSFPYSPHLFIPFLETPDILHLCKRILSRSTFTSFFLFILYRRSA